MVPSVQIQPTDANQEHAMFFTAALFFPWLTNIFNLTMAAIRRGGLLPLLAHLWTNHYPPGAFAFGEERVIMPSSTLTFVINVLLAFVEIKSQGHAQFPFETHPKPTMLSVTSLLMYGLASAAQLVIPADSVCAIIARFARIGFLCVLVGSLASLFYF